jgi:glycerol-3-phosphate acyltransferase PlsY
LGDCPIRQLKPISSNISNESLFFVFLVLLHLSQEAHLNMQIILFIGTLILTYLIGSIPMGLIIVKMTTGQDLRFVQSGRTGGTNAMRAAGFWVGLVTATLDIFKGASGVYLAKSLLPGNHWLEILAPLMSIIGHNYSIFLIERRDGKIRLRGGAGGAPTAGGAMGLWFSSIFILFPIGAFVLFFIGYASVATMSIPIIALIIFAIRAQIGLSPWIYTLYCVFAEILLIIALRPNIKRLINGEERVVGLRAKRARKNKMPESDSVNIQSKPNYVHNKH